MTIDRIISAAFGVVLTAVLFVTVVSAEHKAPQAPESVTVAQNAR